MTKYQQVNCHNKLATVLPAKSDSDVMFCLQIYQGLLMDRSRVLILSPE